MYGPGDAAAESFELPPTTYVSQPTRIAVFSAASRELIYLKTLGTDLELHRAPLGSPAAERTTLLRSRHNYVSPVYGFGLRSDGTIWIHWGDHLALVDEQGAMRGAELLPFTGPRAEWAGADLYVDKPESLWVGVEVGSGRDFVRVRFADVQKRLAPWPAKPKGCADLPDVATLMQWPAQSNCSGGRPNYNAPPPRPPDVIKVLPDGSKIIDAGERGCIRVREEPCYTK